jgi:hypothetical protein
MLAMMLALEHDVCRATDGDVPCDRTRARQRNCPGFRSATLEKSAIDVIVPRGGSGAASTVAAATREHERLTGAAAPQGRAQTRHGRMPLDGVYERA